MKQNSSYLQSIKAALKEYRAMMKLIAIQRRALEDQERVAWDTFVRKTGAVSSIRSFFER